MISSLFKYYEVDTIDTFKNQDKTYLKLYKMFSGYIQLKTLSFRLSDYSLRWITWKNMTTKIYTKIGETMKRNNKMKI